MANSSDMLESEPVYGIQFAVQSCFTLHVRWSSYVLLFIYDTPQCNGDVQTEGGKCDDGSVWARRREAYYYVSLSFFVGYSYLATSFIYAQVG